MDIFLIFVLNNSLQQFSTMTVTLVKTQCEEKLNLLSSKHQEQQTESSEQLKQLVSLERIVCIHLFFFLPHPLTCSCYKMEITICDTQL